MKYTFDILPNEFWWGGTIEDGVRMPFSTQTRGYTRDFRVEALNQTMPLYISNLGRYIWTEQPFAITIDNGCMCFECSDVVTMTQAGDCLRDAYLSACRAHFPFSGELPPKEFFETAQYNTWMEFTYHPTQEGVLAYAHAIVDNGFKPGILIIDEGWHRPYGDWTFDPLKFPAPRAMVDELHALGFKVMLWVVPYVTASGIQFINAIHKNGDPACDTDLFMRNEEGECAVIRWWNGYGAILDLSDTDDAAFLDRQLQALMRDIGVDGFKFDGGTLEDYSGRTVINGQYRGTADGTHDPMEKNIAWNAFGARYTYHEFKDTFKGGGKPVIQRLRDRDHAWDGDGIRTILPNSLVQSLIGHPFICPDMIGGGQWIYNFKPDFVVDQELFVRMAQLSVFFPMMQFSWSPWRVLDDEHFSYVKEAADLHTHLAPELWQLLQTCAKTGEPMMRPLEYMYPHSGFEHVTDEFMCADDILVCPITTKGTFEKELIFPQGTWRDSEGRTYTQGRHTVQTPIGKLPWFRRV